MTGIVMSGFTAKGRIWLTIIYSKVSLTSHHQPDQCTDYACSGGDRPHGCHFFKCRPFYAHGDLALQKQKWSHTRVHILDHRVVKMS